MNDDVYEDVLFELNDVMNKINELKQLEVIKEYNRLMSYKSVLEYEKDELYAKKKKDEYKKCNHIFMNNSLCIKCGYNNSFKDLSYINYDILSNDDKISFDYYSENGHEIRERKVFVEADKDLVMAIYKRIKESYKDINDYIIAKYLKAALFNIKYKDNYEKRNKSRLRRLELENKNIDFNNIWLDKK